MRAPSIFVAIFLAFISCGSDEKLEPDYEIYSALLTSESAPEGVWIVKREAGIFSLQVIPNRIKANFEGLSDETLDDFAVKSKEVNNLQNSFSADLNVRLMSTFELDSLLGGRDGYWENFSKQMDPNHGLTTFSRIGYNNNQTQALLYYENTSGPLAGAGYFVIFEKKSGKWTEVARMMAWVS
jgi:hypothetical protein